MLTLALETAGRAGSVALLDDNLVRGFERLDPAVRSAQSLAPAIDRLLKELHILPQELKLIAAITGPGSFTGLRVGVTTAKTLAYALGCEVIGIDTLDAIAAQAPGAIGRSAELNVVMDAQRRELFLGRFSPVTREAGPAPSPWQRCGPTELVSAEAWLSQLAPQTMVSGPGLTRLVGRLPAGVTAVAAELWEPTADTVGRLAFAAWQSGRRDDLLKLVPTYIRPSYAEEKTK